MKRQKDFRISVPKPCHQQWEHMPEKDTGRFCSSCQKTVVDFSGLSDNELLQYFSTTKNIPCGRFHHDQLGKNLVPAVTKHALPVRMSGLFSAVLALCSFKPAIGAPRATSPVVTVPASPRQWGGTPQDVVVSGKVMAAGLPLAGVSVLLDQKQVAVTDSNGHFEFSLSVDRPSQSHLLEFQYPGMVSVVRNYHAAMQSTSYDITMQKPANADSWHTMGVPVTPDFPIIEFYIHKTARQLTAEHRKILDTAAMKMRAAPFLAITICGFAAQQQDQKSIKKWESMVRDYLINEQGISSDRFTLETTPVDTGKDFMIQIRRTSE